MWTHVKDVAIGKYFPSKYEEPLQVDEHFIALHTPIGDDDVTIKLISLNTFQVERSLSCLYFGSYDDGYSHHMMWSEFMRNTYMCFS